MPTVPLGREEVEILGAGLTSTVEEADLVVSATEMAVTVTVRLAANDAGELYLALVAVVLVKLPHAVPLQAAPETCQVTPWLAESLVSVAVKPSVSPASRVV